MAEDRQLAGRNPREWFFGANLRDTMRLLPILLAFSVVTSVGCHPGPIVDMGPKPVGVGGTIAGIVSTNADDPMPGRKVTAINTVTGVRFEAKTGINGGYTIKLPEGMYRIEVELQTGEAVAKQPDETRVNKSDLDPRRNFVITLGRAGK